MKKYLYILTVIGVCISCNDGFIDDITPFDPGPDQEPPAVTVSSPASGNLFIPFTETQSDINVNVSVTDDIELSSVSIRLDGSEVANFAEFTDFRSYSGITPINSLEVGDYKLNVIATDLSGKTTDIEIDFTVTNEYIPQDGEIFYMPFEGDTDEDRYKDLLSEEAGIPSGSPAFVDGVAGQALELDAANQSYVLFPSNDAISGVTSFSYSFWTRVNFVDEDDNGGIDGILGTFNLSNSNAFWGNINTFIENGSSPANGADLRVAITNGGTTSFLTNLGGVQNIFDRWSHHVVVYDDDARTISYYVNGSLGATVDVGWDTNLAFQDAGEIILGCVHFMTNPSSTSATGSQPWASYLTGELDEVKMFNKVLTNAEITALFNANNPN